MTAIPFERLGRVAVLIAAAASCVPSTVAAQRAYPSSGQGGNYMHNFYFPPAPSSTPWAPAWSPDGSSIAVGMSGSIWAHPASGMPSCFESGSAKVASQLIRKTVEQTSPLPPSPAATE